MVAVRPSPWSWLPLPAVVGVAAAVGQEGTAAAAVWRARATTTEAEEPTGLRRSTNSPKRTWVHRARDGWAEVHTGWMARPSAITPPHTHVWSAHTASLRSVEDLLNPNCVISPLPWAGNGGFFTGAYAQSKQRRFELTQSAQRLRLASEGGIHRPPATAARDSRPRRPTPLPTRSSRSMQRGPRVLLARPLASSGGVFAFAQSIELFNDSPPRGRHGGADD